MIVADRNGQRLVVGDEVIVRGAVCRIEPHSDAVWLKIPNERDDYLRLRAKFVERAPLLPNDPQADLDTLMNLARQLGLHVDMQVIFDELQTRLQAVSAEKPPVHERPPP